MLTRSLRSIVPLLAFVSSLSASALTIKETERWKDDLDVYRQTLARKHINLYHRISKERFDAEIAELKTKLQALNEQQVIVELMRITRLVGDGHTQAPFWDNDHHRFPIGLKLIEGEFRVIRAGSANRSLLGTRLVSIDGTPVARIRESLSPVVQAVENSHSLQRHLATHINVAEILYGLNISKQLLQATFVFADDKGGTTAARLTAVPGMDFYEAVPLPLNEKKIPFGTKRLEMSEYLWLSMDDATRTAYLYFARYPSFSDMEKFASEVRSLFEKHGIRHLIIDLRDNSGGDFFVGLRFAHQMILVDGLDWDGGVYALIGPTTFSAGMSNAAHFKQMFNATLVGEPTGANPVGYQDMDGFVLPNSKRRINYSKRLYRFQDRASDGIQPDVPVTTTWAVYRQGTDAAFNRVMADIARRRRKD